MWTNKCVILFSFVFFYSFDTLSDNLQCQESFKIKETPFNVCVNLGNCSAFGTLCSERCSGVVVQLSKAPRVGSELAAGIRNPGSTSGSPREGVGGDWDDNGWSCSHRNTTHDESQTGGERRFCVVYSGLFLLFFTSTESLSSITTLCAQVCNKSSVRKLCLFFQFLFFFSLKSSKN